jgi:cytochrome c oxidase cbb3-type subunit III
MSTDERPGNTEDRSVHVYDGDLQEEDNRLPLWWLYTLYGAVVFALLYWYGEHELKVWAPRELAYQQEMVAVRLEEAKKNGGALPPEVLLAMSRTPATVDEGKQVFTSTCAPCHRADGGGNIGPNLTDDFWLHGSQPQNIFACVHDGVPTKGMPTWGPQIGDAKVAAVVAYVLTIKGTNVPGGKPPQGDKDL